MSYKKLLLFIICLLNCQFIFAQNTKLTETNQSNFYTDLVNTNISLVNQKKNIKLKDFNSDVTVVIFLAGWCIPCGAQISELNQLQLEFKNKNFRVIGLDFDHTFSDEEKNIKRFIKRFKPTFLIGQVDEKIGESLTKTSNFFGIPQTVIIYKNNIRGFFIGGSRKTSNEIKESVAAIFNN